MAHAKEVLIFEKAGAKIKKAKNALKIAVREKCLFLQTNEKCKNGCDFARRLIYAEKMHGAKNGCNLLTGQKAAKAGWRVFDSGRRGGNWGNPGYWQKNHWALVAGQSGPLVKNHWSLAARRRANPGHLQKCAMPAVQKHAIQAAKPGVIQNPPKFDLRGI